jgi:PTS system mannitol-specific IIC component
VIFGSGLRAPASPGSIFAILFQTAQDSYVGVILSVILSATVTFLVAAVILRASRKRDLEAADAAFTDAIAQTEANKGKSSAALAGLAAAAAGGAISNIVFACDAGMGSSAMGATVLRKKLKDAGVTGVTVTNKAIANLDGTADLVITQKQLTDRAKKQEPNAVHVSVDNFMNSPAYDEVAATVAASQKATK